MAVAVIDPSFDDDLNDECGDGGRLDDFVPSPRPAAYVELWEDVDIIIMAIIAIVKPEGVA